MNMEKEDSVSRLLKNLRKADKLSESWRETDKDKRGADAHP